MRARHFLALFVAGLTAAAAAGCDGDGNNTGGAGGTGGSTGGTGGDTGGTMTTTTSDTTPTTTTPTGDGNDSFAEAIEASVFEPGQNVTLDDLAAGTLDPVATDQDYFKFTGVKGQALLLTTYAKTGPNSPDGFADGFPDLVLTLFNDKEEQIAQNDDPIPRNTQDSSLYTVLPADGTYYVKIEEFCQVLGAGAGGCDDAYFDAIEDSDYWLGIFKLDGAEDGTVIEGTDNDMPYSIADSEYVENSNGDGYFAIAIEGSFKGAMDEDVFNFTVPNAIPVSQGRETAVFELYPTGVDGNGSDTATGLAWIEDEQGNVIAQVDGTKLDPIDGYPMEAPLTFGQPYSLHVKSGGTPPNGGNSFYYLLHYRTGSNPLEMNDSGGMDNDTLANAEVLPTLQSAGGFDGGFIAGDITAGDVDYYVLEAQPAAGDNVFATCSAQRIGSGLRNLKITVIDADTGNALPGGTGTETINGPATLGDTGVPPGNATTIVLKVEATQDPVVTGTYYQCGVVFIPPQ
ncbi:MAG: pre-peptidase C-terminal domain-containing protein [Polyangiaceae bacterium]